MSGSETERIDLLGLEVIVPVSILCGVLCVDYRTSLRLMFSQPICGGLLTGLILGEPFNGLLAGTLIQIMFLGNFFVRGAKTLDLPVAGVVSAALFVLVDLKLAGDVSVEAMVMMWALFFGLLTGYLGYYVYKYLFFKLSDLAEHVVKKGMEGELWHLSFLHFLMLVFHFLYGFIVIVAILPIGYKTILYFVSSSWRLTGSVELLCIFLPFIGIGSLLRIQILKSQGFWFISGLIISAVFLVLM